MGPAIRIATRVGFCVLAAASAPLAHSGEVVVRVFDEHGEPVPDIAVYAEPLDSSVSGGAVAGGPPAIMDQIGSQFVPHILVVQTGAEVFFPNNDTVSHHVYSFSEAKTFQLDLYRGNPHPPQVFDKAGLVVLGCNIHDSMLGFILIVDTPFFGKTDAEGETRLPGLQGGYRVNIWTPRVGERHLPVAQEVSLAASENRDVTFQFAVKLQPPHSTDPGSLEWKHY